MNGLANTLVRTAKTLEERGLPPDSFFEVVFEDGSTITEKDVNWSELAEERKVSYFEGLKTVMASELPLTRITVRHAGLSASIAVPVGCETYQAVRSETVLMDGRKQHRVVGRVIGLIKDGQVMEEQFINGVEGVVVGTRI